MNDEAIRTRVTGTARVRFNSVGGGGHSSACALAVKYIANKPAKNINSLESHTMVPMLTMLGRLSECTREVIAVPVAIVRLLLDQLIYVLTQYYLR